MEAATPARLPGLNDRERRAMDFIRDRVTTHGFPPSIRELGNAVGLTSTSSVAYVLTQLEAKGRIRRMPGLSRGLTILEAS